MDRTDATRRLMLQSCGFTYDATLDAYMNERDARVLSVDTILAQTDLWLAQWITRTLSPPWDAETTS